MQMQVVHSQDRTLRAHSVNGDYTPFDFQQLKYLRYCRNFICLCSTFYLAQTQTVFYTPRMYAMKRCLMMKTVFGTADGFAVNSNDPF
jgi:hypothetical protein